MRIGFVVHVMQVAGAEVLITKIIDQLRDVMDPTIFCLDSMGELGEKLAASGIPVVVLNRKRGIDLGLSLRFAKEIRHRRIDIIHAHQYTPFFYSALAKLSGCWKTKLILTEHGRHYPDVVSWKRRFVNRYVFSQLCNRTTACCDFSATALRTMDGFSDVLTIHNGVDIASVPTQGTNQQRLELRTRLGLERDMHYVTCIARFHPVKDHATLLRSWPIVQAKQPRSRLILVGDGSERSKMEDLTRTLGIADSVQFWGIRQDIFDILQAVDVFTLTSVSEASSLTLLEAMASQCPVVITDVGGNGEHVTDGVEGFLVPRGDYQTLAARLIRLLSDEAARARMGAAARRRVEQEFELDTTIGRYRELYFQLVQG